MKRKKTGLLPEKKRFVHGRLFLLSIVLASALALGFVLSAILLQTEEIEFSYKAAIIDQLGNEFPSSQFNETGTVARILKSAGFNVSYHRSETVNVALYKKLMRYNYGIIIVRAHSATREDKTLVDFFTSEDFSAQEYVSDQRNGLLTKGHYFWKPDEFYFAITPMLIENLEGQFPKSIVIAMGCNSLNETCTEMAEAFIKKGAEAYIGWTGLVQPSHTDNETVNLIRKLIIENKTLSEAVDTLERDPLYRSRMEYYPLGAGNMTISHFVPEAKCSLNNPNAAALFKPELTVHTLAVTPKVGRVARFILH